MGRNLGLAKAQTDILVYADDDILAFPTWLEGIIEAFSNNEDVVLVGGKNLPKFETDPPYWIQHMWKENEQHNRILGYLSILDLGDDMKEIDPHNVYGCNFSIRKSVLLSAGGFHPDSMPEDVIRYRGDGETYISRFVFEKGYKALYHPMASIYHHVPASRMTVEYFCVRSFNQGISDSYTDIRDGKPERLRSTPIRDGLLKMIHRIMFFNEEGDRHHRIEEAYRKGYTYHQRQVREDPKIREWVLRDNYLGQNGRLPL